MMAEYVNSSLMDVASNNIVFFVSLVLTQWETWLSSGPAETQLYIFGDKVST